MPLPTLTLSSTPIPVTPSPRYTEPVRVIWIEPAKNLVPQHQEWDARCAMLVLRESFGTNPEESAMCGEYR